MAQFVAICQKEDAEQYWWFQDKPEGRCAEPDCDCQPRYFVAVPSKADLKTLKQLRQETKSEALGRAIRLMEGKNV